MEVKIGVQHANRELVIDSGLTGEELAKSVESALSGETAMLSLTDVKGRQVLVPTDKLAYVEIGTPSIGQVGFRS